MKIKIEQAKIALATKYAISTDSRQLHAKKRIFSLDDFVEIADAWGNVATKIKGYIFPLFRKRYAFELGEHTYEFRTLSIWKGVYSCIGQNQEYTLLRHRGLNHSIFRGQKQIGAVQQDRTTLFDGDTYEVEVDVDLLVIVCMALFIDVSDGSGGSPSTVTVNLGNIGPEERPFDETWEPNK